MTQKHYYVDRYMLVQVIASIVEARRNCIKSGNQEWQVKHEETLKRVQNELPQGSGIDCGTRIDLDASTADKVVLVADFHHMDQNGSYDGWTEHTITVRPSFINQVEITISGRNRNDIKTYLGEVFHQVLTHTIDQAMFDRIWPDVKVETE
jgi:hypothetical protein